ncbi:unnamed protein product [Didymodactylos carnosus]|uniref:Uncharacterized protein n=1 Tax=Didymodactylos carnosus TaxID=1234261 RepID=A0A813TYP7_9BILA|nr:unnamed protein product [Didymodactylos carnosus]CAF0822424.1 unnamed protein product [Didymodactylos carnosus]CAF3606751.1 unnamed protein product [Didymodactylos carnosus]CAF3606894.1 unnamed protein product [Didymodactylos carnosus]
MLENDTKYIHIDTLSGIKSVIYSHTMDAQYELKNQSEVIDNSNDENQSSNVNEIASDEINLDEDEKDPIIAEVNVYLTRVFSDQLYLFQYPLRSNHLQFENDVTFVGARLKPKNKVVQLDYMLDTKSKFYSKKRNSIITKNLSSSEDAKQQQTVDLLTLSSTNVTIGESYKRFSIGILTQNGLHLSPLNAIFQLRSDFDSTMSIITKNATLSSICNKTIIHDSDDASDDENNLEESTKTSTGTDTEDESKYNKTELVTMKFWRPETLYVREKKIRSYNYLMRKRNEEKWLDFAYISHNEQLAHKLREKWCQQDLTNNSNSIRRNTITMKNYFELLLNKQVQKSETTSSTRILNTNESDHVTEKLVEENTKKGEKKSKQTKQTTPARKKTNTPKTSRKNRTGTSKLTDSSSTINATTANESNSTSLAIATLTKPDPEAIHGELVSFMKRRFGYRPYFKLSEINIAIKLELISSPPGHVLATGVTEPSIIAVASELGAIHINKKWPKNLKQEPVFLNAQMGDKYDILRKYIADLLEKCDSFNFTDFRARIKRENKAQLFPLNEVKKFVQGCNGNLPSVVIKNYFTEVYRGKILKLLPYAGNGKKIIVTELPF